jgi:hypothetical protein
VAELRTGEIAEQPATLRAVPDEELRLTLHDGETLAIAGQDISRVCENLWQLSPEPDALVLAAVVFGESGDPPRHSPLELTSAQSAVIRKALAMPEA